MGVLRQVLDHWRTGVLAGVGLASVVAARLTDIAFGIIS